MLTPHKGDYESVPLNASAKKIADAWDPSKDETEGNQCKSYGGAAIMRVPGRLHITWQDDTNLKIETDAGMQTRLFHFGEWTPGTGSPSWQGDSSASVDQNGGRGRARVQNRRVFLKVVTTHMRPGYLRKNGVPYSDKAVVTEYFDFFREPDNHEWMEVTTIVDDPTYLTVPFVTSSTFKKETDGARWDPQACTAK